ncbi:MULTISPECIES: GNAT family N-acetyltransferase [Streptomyces]|uniref:GNAT family N-acetyltransferase n=1 Tax=Streptomyces aurantiacus group TaxID=2838335 RepID=UPI0009960A13|nr:GNAT family N-acetyltransferase [Streptomyces yerevanensis]
MTRSRPARLLPTTVVPLLSSVPYGHPEVLRLTQCLHAEQLALYGFADEPDDTPAGHFAPPRGLFVIARLDGCSRAVACGGWRLIAPDTAEIKRMYVQPEARGLSLGRRILQHLETAAQATGVTKFLLETGNQNHAALSLYTACGYSPTPSYAPGRNPAVNRALAKTTKQR